jgi:hypothetical protein
MMEKILCSLSLCFLLFACGSNTDSGGNATTSTTPPPTTASEVAQYPPIPVEKLEYLFDNATYMDATFYQVPVSINQSTLEQIRSSLILIGSEAPTINPACKPIGHIWYQVNGVNVEEADIYLGDRCTYYIWYKDGQPAFANGLTAEGLEFYYNIMRSVQEQAGGGGQ